MSESKEDPEDKKEVALDTVPQFFWKKKPVSDFKQRVRKEARTRFLEKKAEELLDEEELEVLWEAILDNESEPHGLEKRINYDAFCIIGTQASEKAHKFFKASVFLKFPRDQYGRISARAFFRYVMRKVRLTRLRISLTCYDDVGQGYLREQDLENYVFEQIPTLPQLHGLEQDFYPYYVFTAVRKFMFFLDPMRKGKIAIRDIVSSPILHQFNQLRQKQDPNASAQKAARKRDWFSSRSALEVYATYLQLDTDHNGMLSQAEFLKYGNGGLTSVFVERLFQEYLMYKSKETGQLEMDYKTFLDFVLAMENRHTPQAIQYFWRVLDIQRCGHLNVFALNYFFRAVCLRMVELGNEPINAGDIIANELFDMVQPQDPHRITLKDLIRCNCGDTIISILIDINGFWKYDNRESLMHDSQ